ncbi:hypothetical protein CRE_31239 [Caenorhabditis remanei]|uniref:Uncharacterized protein n=1 Tax=Caenorhabditis remanei TaxID=31234 RepID=E3MLR7_CAERE|nr:hypothetical protein CRE_31239 [Caenorhabditis remanei]
MHFAEKKALQEHKAIPEHQHNRVPSSAKITTPRIPGQAGAPGKSAADVESQPTPGAHGPGRPQGPPEPSGTPRALERPWFPKSRKSKRRSGAPRQAEINGDPGPLGQTEQSGGSGERRI